MCGKKNNLNIHRHMRPLQDITSVKLKIITTCNYIQKRAKPHSPYCVLRTPLRDISEQRNHILLLSDFEVWNSVLTLLTVPFSGSPWLELMIYRNRQNRLSEYVGTDVLTVVVVKIFILWFITSCSPLKASACRRSTFNRLHGVMFQKNTQKFSKSYISACCVPCFIFSAVLKLYC